MNKLNQATLNQNQIKEAEPKGLKNTIMGTGGLSARIHNTEFTEKDKLKVMSHSKVNKMAGITKGANL